MRDIEARLRRRRLERYRTAPSPWRRVGRWIAAIAGLWMLYSALLSDHGFFRIWRLQEQYRRTQAELAATSREIERNEAQLERPGGRQEFDERELRERLWVRKGEIIYQVLPDTAR